MTRPSREAQGLAPSWALLASPWRRRSDSGQPEPVGDGRGNRNCAVGGDGDDRVDPMSAGDLDHPIDVGEIDCLCDIRGREADRLRVGVDGDHPPAGRARLSDGGELRHACAQKQDGRHGERS